MRLILNPYAEKELVRLARLLGKSPTLIINEMLRKYYLCELD